MGVSSGIPDEGHEGGLEVTITKEDDHISKLPEDILSLILSFLTMRDAVKARVLSMRWRYICAAKSHLHFDLSTLFGITSDQCYFRDVRDDFLESKLRFVRAVDQVLHLCKSPKIDSFKVCYFLGNELACHIDQWINFAVRKQTKELYLRFSLISQSQERYNFPCHLLPQGKACQLKHLSLQECAFMPSHNFTICLRSLIKLQLKEVPLDETFNDILSSCISLEFLRLEECVLPEIFSICGLNMRCLILNSCEGAKKIVVSAINLTTISFIGTPYNLNLIDVPSLKKLFLKTVPESYPLKRHAQDLPQLQCLTQTFFIIQRSRANVNIVKFHHLIKLEMLVILAMDFDFLSVALILNACPHLQKFHLAVRRYSGSEKWKWKYSEQLYPQLREVQISGFRDKCNMLGLAKYLLRSAVGLECMIISSRVADCLEAGMWVFYKGRTMLESERDRIREVLSKEKIESNVKLFVI